MTFSHSEHFSLSSSDFKQLENRSLSVDNFYAQIKNFQEPRSFTYLVAPLTAENGIQIFTGPDCEIYAEVYDRFLTSGSVCKFVPGSTQGNRIFKSLATLNNTHDQIDRRMLNPNDKYTEQNLRWFYDFIQALPNLPLAKDLSLALESRRMNLDTLLKKGEYKEILKAMLDSDGLDFSSLPFGLINVHSYPDIGPVTALEEHLIQDFNYLMFAGGNIHLHVTSSNTFYPNFKEHILSIHHRFSGPGIHLKFELSIQAPSSDTIAMDFNGTPIRNSNSEFLFLPSGHGALLPNLSQIDSDLVFIKNMYDVCHESHRDHVGYYQKVLAGYLVQIRSRIVAFLEKLDKSDSLFLLEEIRIFSAEVFNRKIPDNPISITKDEAISLLNRPLRVCGIIRTQDSNREGRVFLVRNQGGGISPQIVDEGEVDNSNREQIEIYNQATHYNPVHIVCSFKDYQGNSFDLNSFSIPGFRGMNVTHKNGEPICNLERPGLWNGGMEAWNSIFVEIPKDTYFPLSGIRDIIQQGIRE